MEIVDLIIIGGGQSALACAYYLRRTNISYRILDAAPKCGGSWIHGWQSLTLFSPAAHSSLPGWFMPESEQEFPSREEVISYLCRYEERYKIKIERPIMVKDVRREGKLFRLVSDGEDFFCRALISATGTFGKPFIPDIPGRDLFNGLQLHSSAYHNPQHFLGKKVLVVGEGNSGAQILSELSEVAPTVWSTRKAPTYLPDHVDGRVLFEVASAQYYAEERGEIFDASMYHLGNIVMVPPVRRARERGVLKSRGSFIYMDKTGVIWEDNTHENFDVIIWCTGFGYSTDHLKNVVKTDEQGRIRTEGTRATEVPGLWLVGYGAWTGFASATLIGVGRSARSTVNDISNFLKG